MTPRPFAEIQGALREIVADLSKVDDQLATLRELLPAPTAEFNVKAQLREALDCVRIELVGDAIATLDGAASRSPARFLVDYRERLRRLGGLW